MILDKEIKIKINMKNIDHYKFNYDCELRDIINVNPYHVIKTSKIKVNVKCEICGEERELAIVKYWKNKNNGGYYGCRGCSKLKSKKTCVEKYGVEHYSQLETEKEKMSKWMSSNKFKEKSKESMLEKYGYERFNQTKEFSKIMSENKKERASKWRITNEKTCIEKYGVNNYMKTEEFRSKSKETMLDKYGVEYAQQSDEIFNKTKESFIEKYGVGCPFESNEIKERIDDTFMEKYGVNNPFKSKKVRDKIWISKVDKGLQSPDLPKYTKFKNKVIHQTRKNKGKLIEEWDGYDYYDGEYIKGNFKYNPSSKNYPTIDHKISVLYGYLNNMTIEELSNIENLCITKRFINSSKGFRNESDFEI